MRASAFAAVCVLVSAALHVLAGGTVVRLGSLCVALAAAWAGAYLLGGRRRGVSVLLGACFAAQYGMHHLFGATLPDLPSVGGHAHGGGLGMLAVHAAAAFGSAWWLARGEAALATLLRLAVTSVGRFWATLLVLAGAPIEISRPGRTTGWDGPAAPPRAPFMAAVSRRGPPLVLSVL
ncbi:MFS transporter [Nonomuraea sp. KC401]|uniref:MFS transporter n=1 Tax=unclassified Nonomuraea TaxID=2593643 RepID=UPI0010FE58BC|nr:MULTISPECIES: MFS transporter [unclassified Nonomuraea]NBE95485.1 MFS transporter [Nonomuraea sp. K271]TLF83448.1 MFS transporter [Nonomuraea sp. KC401]